MRFIEKRYIIALLICFLNGLTYLIYIEFNRSLEWLITSNVSTSRDRRTIARTLDKSQSAVMVGYLLTPVPGAFVVNRYGGVMVLGFTMLLYAVLVVLVDNLTSINFFQLLTIRLIEGVLNSMRCSALADVWARWCTQQDRSRYISTSILGSQIIKLAYYSFLGKIFSKLERDLDQIFLRGTAIACGIWAAIWLSLCKNDPSEDKHLSDNERAILQPRLKYLDEKGVSWNRYPWQEILKSKPLWTLIGISFISGITNDQLHKHLPDFMRIPILEDDDASSPVVPGIESVFVPAGVLMAAYIVDRSRNHSLYTTTMVHKFIICGGFMVQAILLLIIHFFFPTFKLYTILEAFVTLASMIIEYDVRVNVLDLSLRYASLVNGIRCASSMTSRMFDNAFINEEKEDWLAFFIIISIFYAIGALIYYIWGSGEVQPWNSISSKNSNNATVIWKSIEEDKEKLID